MFAILVAALLGELFLRLCFQSQLASANDERTLLYRYHPQLGWFPIPDQGRRVVASRPFTVTHNREGFRDVQWPQRRGGGLLFLGDSFVWGYDVDASERFTDKLRARHPGTPVYNLGISGYGTDQEFLLLGQEFDRFKPQIVFVVFCVETDHDDNSTNVRYLGYYKPYFTQEGGALQLKGVPVPRAERAFAADHKYLAQSYLVRLAARGYYRLANPKPVRNPDPSVALLKAMHRYVQGKGAVLAVGLTARDPAVESALAAAHIRTVDLSTDLRFPDFGNHWTPEGHTFVAEAIEKFLASAAQVPGP